jgi:hypothetical protein
MILVEYFKRFDLQMIVVRFLYMYDLLRNGLFKQRLFYSRLPPHDNNLSKTSSKLVWETLRMAAMTC